MGISKSREIERRIAQRRRWRDVAPDADDATLDALDALAGGAALEQRAQQDRARTTSKATRAAQADADARMVAGVFAAAYRPGMGRVGLQAAAAGVLKQREAAERDRLLLAQAAGNKMMARRYSAALQALQRQALFITVHRAGKWLQQHHPPPRG
jgi:hypothetical protein